MAASEILLNVVFYVLAIAAIAGAAAVAENHSVIPRNIASDNQASCTRGDVIGSRVYRWRQSRYLMKTTSFCFSL